MNLKIRSNLEESEITSSVLLGPFLFTNIVLVSIESSGILPPEDLFLQAVALLRSKCQILKSEIDANRHSF